MPPGTSLRAWSLCGLLSREVSFACAMLGHYKRLVIVSHGDASDREVLAVACAGAGVRAGAGAGATEQSGRIALVCNETGEADDAYVAHMPGLVHQAVKGASRVVVRTYQLECGQVAVKLCHGLVQRGLAVALVARGEYLWTRVLASENGSESPGTQEAGREEGALCWAADLVVGTTDGMIRDLAWRYGLHASRTRVVPPVVIGADADLPVEREAGLIMYVGPLLTRHRVETIVRAVAQTRESIANAHLEIWGDGPQRAALDGLCAELKLPVRFVAVSTHEELTDRLQACQVCAHASDAEDHLLGILQAMACGAPVVAMDAPAVARLVLHGMTGLRVEGSPESFSVAFQGMLADADWREMLGTNAMRMAQEQFGLARVTTMEIEAHGVAGGFAFNPNANSQNPPVQQPAAQLAAQPPAPATARSKAA